MAVQEASNGAPESGMSGSGRLFWLAFAAGIMLFAASLTAALQSPYADAYGYAGRGWIDWLLKPLESHPEKRLLRVDGDIHDIAMAADGKQGYAVGDGGLILTTDDGGLDWVRRETGESTSYVKVATSGDGQVVVAIADGLVKISRDRGKAWQSARSFYIDGMNAADVAVSQDGAQIWIAGSIVTLSGRVPVVVRSKGEGQRWTETEAQFPAFTFDSPTAMDFAADNLHGWLGSTSGRIYATVDGGESWNLTTGSKVSAAQTRAASGFELLAQAGLIPQSFPAAAGARAIPARFEILNKNSNVPNAPVQQTAVPTDVPVDRGGKPLWQRTKDLTAVTPNTAQDKKSSATGPPRSATNKTRPGSVTRKKAQLPRKARPKAVVSEAKTNQAAESIARAKTPVTTNLGESLAISYLEVFDKEPKVRGISGFSKFFTLSAGGATKRSGSIFSRSPAEISATGIAFINDKHGWAVGDPAGLPGSEMATGPVIVTTSDSGDSWKPQYSKRDTFLTAIAATDANHVWAAGKGGTILATQDGGAHWFPQLRKLDDKPNADPYRRYPAPWYYLALLGTMALLWRGIRPQPVKTLKGAAAIGASDSPTMSFAQDKLQFAALARGISLYLRNVATTPPMTLAVAGDWGTGKSSLMRLICADLEAHGNRPVWFNAWHHQDQEQLLAALLATIRDEALPHWWTADGIKFRLHLFWLRAQRSLPTTLLLLALTVALAGFFLHHERDQWIELNRVMTGGLDEISKTFLGGSLASIAALIAVIGGLRRALKSFGSDPAVLLTNTIENFKLRDATAQINFRTRFQTQFKEVTQALPYPLVIVIDDLDRCRADTVLSVMESVNFLMSSGPCFVIFGMATERVQAALAMSFKDIAQELVTIDVGPGGTPSDADTAARAKRHKYAGDYLEKLINLEIRVPTRADIAPHLLLIEETARAVRTSWIGAVRGWVPRLVPLLLIAAVSFGAWEFGTWAVPVAKEVVKGEVAPARKAESAPDAGSVQPVATPDVAVVQEAPVRRVTTEPGVDSRAYSNWPLYLSLALLMLVVGAIQFARTRAALSEVKDSDAFAEALKIWVPVVAQRASAPRSIKRFGNRLRYFAMLQQAEVRAPSPEERVEAWLRGLVRRGGQEGVVPPVTRVDTVAEHRIVALGAMQTVYGDDWRGMVLDSPIAYANLATRPAIQGAIDAYVKATGASWPPSASELDAFERSLKGIRLGGGVNVLSDRPVLSPSPPPPPRPAKAAMK